MVSISFKFTVSLFERFSVRFMEISDCGKDSFRLSYFRSFLKDVPGFFFSFFTFYFCPPSPSEFIQLLIKINTLANNPKSR